MSVRAKLIAAIRNNPKDVRFDDACKVAGWLGFTVRGGEGSHNAFARPGEETVLVLVEGPNGKLKPYQARQLISMIDKYEDEQ